MTPTPGYARDVLRRRLPAASMVALGVVALALIVAVLWPPVYRAEAVLLASPPDTATDTTNSFDPRAGRAQASTIAQRLLTRARLLEASQRLALHDTSLDDAHSILEDMRARITVHVEGGGDYALTIRLGFSAANPRVAANVANALAEVLISESLTAPDALTLQRRDILERETRRRDAELERYSAELAEFRAANAGALPDALPALRAQAAALQASLSIEPPQDLDQDTASNPALNPVLEQVSTPPDEDRATRLAQLRAAIAIVETNAVTLARLERAHAAAEARYRAAMHRVTTLGPNTGVEAVADAPTNEAITPGLTLSMLDPARTPERPETPDRGGIAAAGLGLGLLAGLVFILGAEALDQTVRHPRDISRRLGQAPLATIPLMPLTHDARHRRLGRPLLRIAIPAGLVLFLYGIHLLVLPLDVALSRAIAQLGLEPLLIWLHQAVAG